MKALTFAIFLDCPYDFFTERFYKESDDPNLPDWYFKICGGDRFQCRRDSKTVCKCWEQLEEKMEE